MVDLNLHFHLLGSQMELVDSHGLLLPLNHSICLMTARTQTTSKAPHQPFKPFSHCNILPSHTCGEHQHSLYVALGLSLIKKYYTKLHYFWCAQLKRSELVQGWYNELFKIVPPTRQKSGTPEKGLTHVKIFVLTISCLMQQCHNNCDRLWGKASIHPHDQLECTNSST